MNREQEDLTGERYYVYALVDPRDGQTFYIGKGCGRRAWMHETMVRKGRSICNVAKVRRIEGIIAAGLSVSVSMLHEGLGEAEAYVREAMLIAEHRVELTNVADGGVAQTRPASAPGRRVELFLLKSAIRTLEELAVLRRGRTSEPLSSLERSLVGVTRENCKAYEDITGESLAGGGFQLEWAA